MYIPALRGNIGLRERNYDPKVAVNKIAQCVFLSSGGLAGRQSHQPKELYILRMREGHAVVSILGDCATLVL